MSAKLETKALKAKRPGFTDERYNETSYYTENGLRKVYPYYFTFTTFTKGRWVGEKILDVFAKEFRAHPVEEYERCIKSGTLTVNYTKVETDYRLKHNDLLANIVHRHEVPVTSDPIEVVHMDEDLVVVNKPASIPTPVLAKPIEILYIDQDLVVLDKPGSIPVHPCGRYRHNTVVFILAKEHQLKNLRTIHRLDRLTSGLLLFGRSPKKAREMEQQIRNRLVQKEYVCRVEGTFPDEEIECSEPIEVVSYKIGVCKVSKDGKECKTVFKKLSSNGKTSVVLARPRTGRMHQIRVHLQYLGYPIVNDPLYNHPVFGPEKGKGGLIGKTDEQLIQELISIHNAENWLGIEGEDGGGGGGDIFGSSGAAVVVVNDACHLNTASGPSSCTSVQSDNGSSIGSSTGDGNEGAVRIESNNIASPSAVITNDVGLGVPDMKNEETQVAFPLACKEAVIVSGGKVTVGTQTSDEDSSGVGAGDTQGSSATAAAQAQLTQGPDCMSSGSQTAPLSSLNSEEGIPKVIINNNSTPNTSSTTMPALLDNNNTTTAVSITKSSGPPGFRGELMTYDPHCYECKVRYRDPKPKDLVMYLHALTYKGPEWSFETKMPAWASSDWLEPDES
ncbi:RNA pseudouridylate synthase domain-containing protein 2 [Orchesella cincta]|uniref:Pseudouridylate synthase RPUSD2 n=1 Tax=Orchesella cincta TaxID=48709 RepID=A0A1D2N431_ORCCI|nr:RNA pseudouridylate synthase domain-containing protein 2 [Orchesella cincta]